METKTEKPAEEKTTAPAAGTQSAPQTPGTLPKTCLHG